MLKLFDKWKVKLNYNDPDGSSISNSSSFTTADSSVSDDNEEALQRFIENPPSLLKELPFPPPILNDPKLTNKKDQFVFSPHTDYSSLFPSLSSANIKPIKSSFPYQQEQQKIIIKELHNACKNGKVSMVKSIFEEETISLLALSSQTAQKEDMDRDNLAKSSLKGKLLLEICSENPLLISFLLKRGATIPEEYSNQIVTIWNSILQKSRKDKFLSTFYNICLYLERIRFSNGLSKLQKEIYSNFLEKEEEICSSFPLPNKLSDDVLLDLIRIATIFDCDKLIK